MMQEIIMLNLDNVVEMALMSDDDFISKDSSYYTENELLTNYLVKMPIFVPFNSLNNHGLLTCFKAKRIVIDGKEGSDFLVGISKEKMFIDGIDCIISTSLMEGLRWLI